MEKKKLSTNLILNVIKSALSILFPLITLPYISRVLTQDSIGEYNYAVSIINYYSLISVLGIKTFAIKEANKYRNDKRQFEAFASEMFSLNVFFTVIAYMLLLFSFLIFKTFRENCVAIAIISISICFNTVGVEWIFNIFEDFKYITYRSIGVQIASLILMFTLVRNAEDAYLYMAITIIANGGANIFNWFYAQKFCKIKVVINKSIFTNIVPIMVIFFNTLATVIYVNSDLTMIGVMAGNKEVGIYSVATKIYNVVKTIVNSIVTVFIARLAYEYANDRDKYVETFRKASNIIIFITVPLAVAVMLYGKEIILFISTSEYLGASIGMSILFFSVIFATLGNLYGTGALLLAGKEKNMLIATSIGAVINLIINFLLIPQYGCTGAAIGTVCTEVAVFLILYFGAIKHIDVSIQIKTLAKSILSSVVIFMIFIIYKSYFYNELLFIVFGGFSAVVYCLLMLILKDDIALLGMQTILNELEKRISKWKKD